jgi:hypothetical protein
MIQKIVDHSSQKNQVQYILSWCKKMFFILFETLKNTVSKVVEKTNPGD